MTLSMARCIGQAGCDRNPSAGRGLCRRCYARHTYRGTLDNFPTMRERTDELTAHGQVPTVPRRVSRKSSSRSSLSPAKLAANTLYRHTRYAERVLLNGVLIHPGDRHGCLTKYNVYGCRGAMCRATHNHYRRTGQTSLPSALKTNYGAHDCATYEQTRDQL